MYFEEISSVPVDARLNICTCIEIGFCESFLQVMMFIDELTIKHKSTNITMPEMVRLSKTSVPISRAREPNGSS